ncbi:hypothetical protein PAAL109150_21725 [Paenibacillus alkaliterrae]
MYYLAKYFYGSTVSIVLENFLLQTIVNGAFFILIYKHQGVITLKCAVGSVAQLGIVKKENLSQPPVRQVASQTSDKIELLVRWRNPREAKQMIWLRWLLHMVEVSLMKTVIVDSLFRIRRNSVNLIHHKSFLDKYGAKLIVLELLMEVD